MEACASENLFVPHNVAYGSRWAQQGKCFANYVQDRLYRALCFSKYSICDRVKRGIFRNHSASLRIHANIGGKREGPSETTPCVGGDKGKFPKPPSMCAVRDRYGQGDRWARKRRDKSK